MTINVFEGMSNDNGQKPTFSDDIKRVYELNQAAIGAHASLIQANSLSNSHQAEVQTVMSAYVGSGNVLGK